MSLKAVAQVLNDPDWESSTHFLVAIAVANYTGQKGLCFAHYATLARFTKLNERTIGRTIRDLIAAGSIVAFRKQRANGTLGGYVLQIPGVADPRYKGEETETHIVDAESGEARTLLPDDEEDTIAPHKEGATASPNQTESPRNNLRTTLPEDSNQRTHPGADAPDLVAIAFKEWNDTAANCGLPLALKLTTQRRKSIAKRLEEHGIDGWRKALAAVENSKFLCGIGQGRDGGTPWKAGIDFLLQPSKLVKVLEGAYGQDRKPKGMTTQQVSGYQERLRTDERFARTMAHQWTQDPDRWPPEAGPPPGQPGCVLPISVQDAVLGRGSPTGADALAHGVHALAQQHAHEDLLGVDLGREHSARPDMDQEFPF